MSAQPLPIALDANGLAVMPRACLRCGQPSTRQHEYQARRVDWMASLPGILLAIVGFGFVTHRTFRVSVPYCDEHEYEGARAIRANTRRSVAIVLGAIGAWLVPLLFIGMVGRRSALGFFLGTALGLFAITLVGGFLWQRSARYAAGLGFELNAEDGLVLHNPHPRFAAAYPIKARKPFASVDRVRRAWMVLRDALENGRLPAAPTSAFDALHTYDPEEQVVSVQRLARQVAEQYGLKVGTIVVTFRQLKVPAQVELGDSMDFFVEVDKSLAEHPSDLAAALGHEVAHIFLHRHGVRLPETADNEVLTDATACLYGFAHLLAGTYRVDKHQTRALGYMTTEEIGYLLERAKLPLPVLDDELPRAALAVGRRLAEREMRAAPLQTATLLSRLHYLWSSQRAQGEAELGLTDHVAVGAERVAFRCPHCSQGVRIPRKKKLVATCPACKAKLPCKS
ncbi:MAG: hypothetical protein U0271_28720 [Polyangiaceae bacterium]